MVKDEDWCIQYETKVQHKSIFKQPHCRECNYKCDKENKGGVRTNITTMKWIDCWHKRQHQRDAGLEVHSLSYTSVVE